MFKASKWIAKTVTFPSIFPRILERIHSTGSIKISRVHQSSSAFSCCSSPSSQSSWGLQCFMRALSRNNIRRHFPQRYTGWPAAEAAEGSGWNATSWCASAGEPKKKSSYNCEEVRWSVSDGKLCKIDLSCLVVDSWRLDKSKYTCMHINKYTKPW